MRIKSSKRAIDKVYKRRDRYEIPDWQRQEVWSRSKKQNLIDSILRGWKLPKFYFLKVSDTPESFEVVDGQQRLVAIWEFFDGELELADDTAKTFRGKTYSDLPDAVVDAYDDFEIEFDEIEGASEEEIKTFFQRLQQGLPLTSSERLNSIHSKLRDYAVRLAKHKFFKKTTASDKRYGYFDIVAKVAAIEIDGIDVGLRYDDLRAVFESQASFASRSNVAKRLRAALDYVDAGFADTDGPLLRNRTIFQSLLTLACRLVQSGRAKGHEKELATFFVSFLRELARQIELGRRSTDPDYLAFQRTVNANIKSGPRIRQEILLRKLLSAHPTFVNVFDPVTLAESGLPSAIKADAAEAIRLISALNEQHSAVHGTDLFKATNRTAQAQANLAKVVQGFDDYKRLVEDLYFLFWEAVGQRLPRKKPQSFSDVNTLRTALQHDLDHGPKSKVKAKKKNTGFVFKKYAGVPTPTILGEENFVMVQANLLAALKKDLRQLQVNRNAI